MLRESSTQFFAPSGRQDARYPFWIFDKRRASKLLGVQQAPVVADEANSCRRSCAGDSHADRCRHREDSRIRVFLQILSKPQFWSCFATSMYSLPTCFIASLFVSPPYMSVRMNTDGDTLSCLHISRRRASISLGSLQSSLWLSCSVV